MHGALVRARRTRAGVGAFDDASKLGARPRQETSACPADEDSQPSLGVTLGRWAAWPACGRNTIHVAVYADSGWARDAGTEAQTLPHHRPYPRCWDETLVSAPTPPAVLAMAQLSRTTAPSWGITRRPTGVSMHRARTRKSCAWKLAYEGNRCNPLRRYLVFGRHPRTT